MEKGSGFTGAGSKRAAVTPLESSHSSPTDDEERPTDRTNTPFAASAKRHAARTTPPKDGTTPATVVPASSFLPASPPERVSAAAAQLEGPRRGLAASTAGRTSSAPSTGSRSMRTHPLPSAPPIAAARETAAAAADGIGESGTRTTAIHPALIPANLSADRAATLAWVGSLVQRRVCLRAVQILLEGVGVDLASVQLRSAAVAAERSPVAVGMDLQRWEETSVVHRALCAVATEDPRALLAEATALVGNDPTIVDPTDRLAREKLERAGAHAQEVRGEEGEEVGGAAMTRVVWGVVTAAVRHPHVLAAAIGEHRYRASHDALHEMVRAPQFQPEDLDAARLRALGGGGGGDARETGGDAARGGGAMRSQGGGAEVVLEEPRRGEEGGDADSASTSYDVDVLLVESALPADLQTLFGAGVPDDVARATVVTLGDLERTETHANLFGFLVQPLREVWTDVTTVADSSSTRSFDTGSDSALLDDSADEPAHMDMASAPSTRPSSRSARWTERTALPAASTVSFDVFAAHLESTSLLYAHSAVFVWPVEPPEGRADMGSRSSSGRSTRRRWEG